MQSVKRWVQRVRHERSLMRRIRDLDQQLITTEAEKSLPKERVLLACMVIARGEDDYLVEWLEFHRMMGVEHFFFYDNGLQASTAELLRPYIDEGVLTHLLFADLDWPELRTRWDEYDKLSQQEVAYAHCTTRFADRARFFLKIDVDEFVYPARPEETTVAEVLGRFDPVTTLGFEIPRTDFGSNGHTRRTEGLVLERFTRCTDGTRNCKSLGNSVFIDRSLASGHAHTFAYRVPLLLRAIRGFHAHKLQGASASAELRMNHYFSKSLDEYLHKGEVNARGYMAGKETKAMFVRMNQDAGALEDTAIQRFLPELKARMARRS